MTFLLAICFGTTNADMQNDTIFAVLSFLKIFVIFFCFFPASRARKCPLWFDNRAL